MSGTTKVPSPKRKIVKRPVRSTTDYVQIVGRLYSPPLTDTEIEVLAAFVLVDGWLRKKKIPLGAFSTQMRRKVQERLDRSEASINTYVKKLKDKGAIRPDNSVDGGYKIHPLFIPKGEREIVIQLTP